MKYKYIVALDPSGNFNEGKGTTGWCLLRSDDNMLVEVGSITSSEFDTMEGYWNSHLDLLKQLRSKYGEYMLVIEDYLLYNSKKDNQVNSRMETPKLIGAIQLYCYHNKINYTMQPASEVKNRWADHILIHKGFLIPQGRGTITSSGIKINRHMKDAIRHAVHYSTFKNKGD